MGGHHFEHPHNHETPWLEWALRVAGSVFCLKQEALRSDYPCHSPVTATDTLNLTQLIECVMEQLLYPF